MRIFRCLSFTKQSRLSFGLQSSNRNSLVGTNLRQARQPHMIEHSVAIKKTMHSIHGKRTNSVCNENSAHVENLTNADLARPSKRRFDMRGRKTISLGIFPRPLTTWNDANTGFSGKRGKLGMICRLVEEAPRAGLWGGWGDECFLFSFISTFHLPVVALICYKSSTYVHTHAHTRMLWLTTVLVPLAVDRGVRRCTLVASPCIARRVHYQQHIRVPRLGTLSIHKAWLTLASHYSLSFRPCPIQLAKLCRFPV